MFQSNAHSVNEMLKLKEINKIRKLHNLGHSKRSIAKITGVSRNTITKYLECPDKIPTAQKPGRKSPLDAHEEEIKKIFLKCGGNCEAAMKIINETLGLDVKGRNLRRFCQPWRPEAKKAKQREFRRLRAKYQIHKPSKSSEPSITETE